MQCCRWNADLTLTFKANGRSSPWRAIGRKKKDGQRTGRTSGFLDEQTWSRHERWVRMERGELLSQHTSGLQLTFLSTWAKCRSKFSFTRSFILNESTSHDPFQVGYPCVKREDHGWIYWERGGLQTHAPSPVFCSETSPDGRRIPIITNSVITHWSRISYQWFLVPSSDAKKH